jgi:UDP-N-acetylmuramoyl-tripeptide--D-alanyl-D-alanine ligase
VKLPLSRIAEFLSTGGDFDPNAVAQGYSIDSRTIQAGELFFAVKGERLDGHDFVAQAFERGAAAAVVLRDQIHRYPAKSALIPVDDTLAALQTLAACVRCKWGKPVVGITGSAGKTTTKEAIAHILSTRYRVLKSEGNFNNHFGLPLMLLKLQPEHEMAVIEMGMSHAGEITALAKIAQPDIGVVTNVAPVHLEFFDSIAGIARAKYELVVALPHSGTAVLNSDDEYVSQFGRDFKGRTILFGLKATASVRAEDIATLGPSGTRFTLVVGGERYPAETSLVGTHNVYNLLAAIAVASDRGIAPTHAAAALATLKPADKRGQIEEIGGVTVLNDCYNSNPKALQSMVDALAAMPASRRIVVAGEMLELGPSGEELHRECGRYIAQLGIECIVGVRGLAQSLVEAARAAGAKAEFVATPEEAGEWLARETRDGDAVLLKASRGVKLERAFETWKAKR